MQTYTIDGKKYQFDTIRFKHQFHERLTKENNGSVKKEDGEEQQYKTKKTTDALQREIAEAVHVTEETVKSWRRNKKWTTPGDVTTVYALADFFRVDSDYFLKAASDEKESDEKENVHMNTTYTVQETKNHELEVAKTLYASILDAIDATDITFVDFLSIPHHIPVQRGMSKNRYKLILAIRKTAMDLPESVRLPAMELVNDIYGPESEDWFAFYGTEDFKAYINSDDYQAYTKKPNSPRLLPQWVDDYQAYVKSLEWPAGLPEELRMSSLEQSRDFDCAMHYQNYNDYKTAEFYRRLDEIFADYIKR